MQIHADYKMHKHNNQRTLKSIGILNLATDGMSIACCKVLLNHRPEVNG